MVEEADGEALVARDIMVHEVVTVTPETAIGDVRHSMITRGLSGFPVVDGENRVVGVVSESDIIFSEIYQEPHLVDMLSNVIQPSDQAKKTLGESVAEIMTSPAITTLEDASLHELANILLDKKIKRVIVVDPENRPVGLVSRIDLVKAFDSKN